VMVICAVHFCGVCHSDDRVHSVMHRDPTVATYDQDLQSVVAHIQRLGLHHMPRMWTAITV